MVSVSAIKPSFVIGLDHSSSTSSCLEDPLTMLGFRHAGYNTFEEVVQQSIRGEYLEGHNSKVYLIPGIDNFVLKVHKENDISDTPLVLVVDPLPTRNVSQTVAKKGRFEILRKQKGITGGVPFLDLVRPGPSGDQAYRDYINLVANMPQGAFDHLADTMVALSSVEYIFDWCHGRNLMFDIPGEEINVVDISPSFFKLTLGQMVPPLVDTIYAYRTTTRFSDLQFQINTIIDKSIKAAMIYRLPLPKVLGEATRFVEHHRMEYVFQLAGRKGEWPSVRERLLSSHG